MDVSRIEAVSPRQIDWRKLTAKEIIKYDNQGVSVPIEYLQWAREFLNDVSSSDNDETTYESAQQVQATNSTTDAETETVNPEDEEGSEDSEDLTPAQAKRQELNDSGVSLYKQAKIFKKESKKSIVENFSARFTMSNTEKLSDNEIQAVDSYMQRILSKADAAQSELKSELSKVDNSSGNMFSFAKINKLQKELEKYGKEGQSMLANSDGKFSGYDASLEDKSSIIFTGLDVGSETSEIGNELMAYGDIFSVSIGKGTVKKGSKAISSSEKSQALQTEALSKNSQNQNSLKGYISDLESKTGVAGVDNSKSGDDNSDASNQNSQSETSTKEIDKAATGNLDTILQAKIRRGENVEA